MERLMNGTEVNGERNETEPNWKRFFEPYCTIKLQRDREKFQTKYVHKTFSQHCDACQCNSTITDTVTALLPRATSLGHHWG